MHDAGTTGVSPKTSGTGTGSLKEGTQSGAHVPGAHTSGVGSGSNQGVTSKAAQGASNVAHGATGSGQGAGAQAAQGASNVAHGSTGSHATQGSSARGTTAPGGVGVTSGTTEGTTSGANAGQSVSPLVYSQLLMLSPTLDTISRYIEYNPDTAFMCPSLLKHSSQGIRVPQ